MGSFDVHIFLTNCYIPSTISISNDIYIEPFYGIEVLDVANLLDRYLEEVLKQPKQPKNQKKIESEEIHSNGASTVFTFANLQALNSTEAINQTREAFLLYRDILAFRQLQRGSIAGFLVIQLDVSPVRLFASIRPPYPILRKVRNIPIFESEGDFISRIYAKAEKYPILKVYLSLYADSTAYSDSLLSDISYETRMMKIWSLLEAMAYSEVGSKKQKVKNLFRRYKLSTYPDYRNHKGKNLLDIAYKWRNIIVHCGGCSATTKQGDIEFCKIYSADFKKILEDLNQACRFLINAFVNSLS